MPCSPRLVFRSTPVRIVTVLALAASVGGERPKHASADPGEPLDHEWHLVDGKHWTIASSALEAPEVTDAIERTTGACPAGMVEVAGRMKTDGDVSIEALQETTCTEWIRRQYPQRCARFDRDQWLTVSAALQTKPMRFCIDRFEWPNRRGAYPVIFVTWLEAKALCGRGGKRLCGEDEWTFACEGEEASPYPYGYERDDTACVIDRPHRPFDETKLARRDSLVAVRELDRLWQGEACGSRTACRSPFGVYDLTGNVDEWTVTTHSGGYPSILKGGYWGQIRARCRPSTRAHGEDFAFYQQGFRCCSDPPPLR